MEVTPIRQTITCLLLLAGSQHFTNAATTISGSVSGTWTSSGSPYQVVGDVFVSSLIIQSNVQVQFDGPFIFEVDGVLKALGTSNGPVSFSNTIANANRGWKGLYFNRSNPSSFLTYCQVYGSTNSGIRIQDTTPAITDCVIANNSSPDQGGGIWARISSGKLVLGRCIITNNLVPKAGGGISLVGDAQISNCLFSGNQATNAGFGGGTGGGFYLDATGQSGDVTFENCDISGNIANYYGGGIYGESGVFHLRDCKISSNFALISAAGVFVDNGGSSVEIINCSLINNNMEAIGTAGARAYVTNSILFFNNSGARQTYGVTSFAYCDTQDGPQDGPGNFSVNPTVDPATLALLPGSPCIDAGSPDPAFNDVCFPPSQGGPRNDIGAFGGPGACNWLAGDLPTIAQEPQPQSSCLGQSATFAVKALASAPLGYQWYFNGAILNGRTDTSLTLTNLGKSQEGQYFVVVSNSFGSLSSTTNALIVNDACIDLHMYAGLNIGGQPGQKYVLSYTTDLNNPAGWLPLATNLMGNSNWFYLDMDSPSSPYRYYKVVLQP